MTDPVGESGASPAEAETLALVAEMEALTAQIEKEQESIPDEGPAE
ncbi:hypothetical protein Athai_47170 [Actinocatenispora thailandica]|uniref:Uncharacterized protein n=1 Tax=Actinocatenispora thailandica TaxID=227318 RepID=A0A7R7DST7_9ACTN|nr:hypothetical protein [Actinocatenispora thailandica]BCJ37214.1 hypothetical protein Athai_47170 [Actinocatenispora thailandica]